MIEVWVHIYFLAQNLTHGSVHGNISIWCQNVKANRSLADYVCVLLFYTGGIMSSFLMGCYDPASKKWCTVTKCSGGHDDATLARLQKELEVIKIGRVKIILLHLRCPQPELQYPDDNFIFHRIPARSHHG